MILSYPSPEATTRAGSGYLGPGMELRHISSYSKELRPILAANTFRPARARILWLPVHLGVVVLATTALAAGWVSLWFAPLVALVIGMSFAGLAFVAHETLHGSIVRGARTRYLVGFVSFLPFLVSPRLWTSWHNRVHHGHANQPDHDPDANPTLAMYQADGGTRFVTDHLTPGRRSLTGVVGLLVGFTGQSGQILINAVRRGILGKEQHRLASYEFTFALAVWATVLCFVGPVVFLFTFILPLIVGNMIVMGFIFTNHSLNPVTEVNDPLANSLSVTMHPFLEWLTLGFGYHVEHHLFPAMSAARAPAVREQLRELWPERYQSLPLHTALRELHRTGRVYVDDTTLGDPNSGLEWPTLQPRAS